MASTIERALELARGGSCRSVNDIRRRLHSEGYDSVESHLGGKTIRDQLKAAMKERSGP